MWKKQKNDAALCVLWTEHVTFYCNRRYCVFPTRTNKPYLYITFRKDMTERSPQFYVTLFPVVSPSSINHSSPPHKRTGTQQILCRLVAKKKCQRVLCCSSWWTFFGVRSANNIVRKHFWLIAGQLLLRFCKSATKNKPWAHRGAGCVINILPQRVYRKGTAKQKVASVPEKGGDGGMRGATLPRQSNKWTATQLKSLCLIKQLSREQTSYSRLFQWCLWGMEISEEDSKSIMELHKTQNKCLFFNILATVIVLKQFLHGLCALGSACTRQN